MIDFTKDQVLYAIRKVAETTDPEMVARVIQAALFRDIPIADVARELEDTQWRYRLVGGALTVEVESTQSMMSSYGGTLEKIRYIAHRFGIHEKETDFGFRSLNFRDPLGVACKEASVEAARLNEHLLPTDDPLNTRSHVRAILKGTKFRWDGDYEVERNRGENRKLLQQAVAYYAN